MLTSSTFRWRFLPLGEDVESLSRSVEESFLAARESFPGDGLLKMDI